MKRHPADLLSLAFGLLFVLIGLAVVVDVLDLRLLDGEWLWATVLIGAGVAVLLSLSGRDEPEPVLTGPDTAEEDATLVAARREVDEADLTTHRDAADELGFERSDTGSPG